MLWRTAEGDIRNISSAYIKHPEYCWSQSSCGESRLHPAPVCRRLPSLYKYVSRWCYGDRRSFFALSWRRRSLVKFKPVATEPGQDASLVAGLPSFSCLKSTFKTSQRPRTHNIRQNCRHSIRDLGVVIDSGLTMSDHVTIVCRSAYYELRQLRTIARSLSDDAAKTYPVVHHL